MPFVLFQEIEHCMLSMKDETEPQRTLAPGKGAQDRNSVKNKKAIPDDGGT